MTSATELEPPVQGGRPLVVCPYLRSTSGEWRSAAPSREHLCGAQTPMMPLGPEVQRRFCLSDPVACERHRAAGEARSALAPELPIRPIARTAPVILERGRAPLAVPAAIDRRTAGQAGLVVVMIAAAAALIFARGESPSRGSAGIASAGATPSASAGISPGPTNTAGPSQSGSPSPSTRPSAMPSPKPSAAARRTYRIKAGDSLGSIAIRFGTTVKVLQKLNSIKDPSLIRPGQVLKLP